MESQGTDGPAREPRTSWWAELIDPPSDTSPHPTAPSDIEEVGDDDGPRDRRHRTADPTPPLGEAR